VLDNPKLDEIYGIHLWNYQQFGTVGVQPGPVLAAADEFVITVKGRGGHGASPQGTVDAIIVASHLVTAIQTIVSRNSNPLESTALTVGMIQGGYNFNIIADKVVLKGTVRAYTEENRTMINQRLQEISAGVAASFGAEIEVDFLTGYPPTVNSEVESGKVATAAVRIVSDGVQPPYLTMGAEDMSYYLQNVPGCFFFVGSAPEGERVPHHCSHFDINEEALLVGSSIWVELVEGLLMR
jgi:amidohydrolase